MPNNLLLDVRNYDEIANVKYNDIDNKYNQILYIPSNEIKYNIEFLNKFFTNFDNVYIICNSGNRSKQVKDKYFVSNNKVNTVKTNYNKLDDKYLIKSKEINLSLTRKIQIIIGSILLVLFIFSLYNKNIIYILPFMSAFMLYVGISGNCFMSSILTKNDI